MEPKKEILKFSWSQPYTEWEAMREAITELKVENSDFREAELAIKRIMEM